MMHNARMVNVRRIFLSLTAGGTCTAAAAAANTARRQLSATTSFAVYYAIDSANNNNNKKKKKKMLSASSYFRRSLATLSIINSCQSRGWGTALIAADPRSMSSSFYPNCFLARPSPPSRFRTLSTLPPAAAAAAASVGMTEGEFHKIADATLFELFDKVAVLEDSVNADTSLTQGILTIDLSSLKKGIWVINKQTPNRQIWWSSPISGPRRYEHDHDHNHNHNIKSLGDCWKSSKNNSSALLSDLRSEMLKAADINI